MDLKLDIKIEKLSKVETWITAAQPSDDGWSQIKPFIFIRLTTSEGIQGWGEAFTLPYRELAVETIIRNLVIAIANEKDISPYSFRDKILDIADKHRGIDFSAATSAIEMALWDIIGKLSKKPLSHLLCENPNPSVPIYATNWSNKQYKAKANYETRPTTQSKLIKFTIPTQSFNWLLYTTDSAHDTHY